MSEKNVNKLVIAISSRALFDLSDSHQVYQDEGLEAYSKYQIDKEYLHRYDQERRRANRLATRAEGDFELGDELVNNSLGFCLRVPVSWRVSRWESNETDEDYGQEASFNREGKLIPRRIGYTQLSAEPVTSPSPVDWSLAIEVDKYQLEEPRCQPGGSSAPPTCQ